MTEGESFEARLLRVQILAVLAIISQLYDGASARKVYTTPPRVLIRCQTDSPGCAFVGQDVT